MDQQILHALERRCIQEEPPGCAAACPLHVDARQLTGHVAAGRWAHAWKVLQKTMPLPGLLARICDAPCRSQCTRSRIDAPIAMDLLEKAVVAHPAPAPARRLPVPPKHQNVAVVGGGLSSLTVAWDLARKGYGVTIYEPDDRLGACLNRRFPQLGPELIQTETTVLLKLGVLVRTAEDINTPGRLGYWLQSHAAVYLGRDAVDDPTWPLPCEDDGGLQSTSMEGVYSGGNGPQAKHSPVRQAAEGRWAGTSMDRYLQKVSITAARERQGPYESRLYTVTEGIAPIPAVAAGDPIQGYTDAQAQQEAGRCLQCECRECVKACAYLEEFKAYPKKYAREIYNNATVIIGRRQANALINACSLCGLCEQICPHDFSMADLCLTARHELVDQGNMPPSAHDFALLDLAFSQSDRFALARHAPGCRTSRWILFPGCQLCASAPGQVPGIYDHLRGILGPDVGIMLDCCAAPAHWAGRRDLFASACNDFMATWRQMGSPQVIVACSTCHQIFCEHLSRVPVISLWELFAEHGTPAAGLTIDPEKTWCIHDPCTSRHAPNIQSAVRDILRQSGMHVEELAFSGITTECCGYGGLMQAANPDLAEKTASRRAASNPNDYIAYCAMCRDNLAGSGKRIMHLLDLFWPQEEESDPLLRTPPGWSQRRENREWLKRHLLETLWQDEGHQMHPEPEHRQIKLAIAQEVADKLDHRRILVEDLQQVIYHGENSGRKLIHPQTGCFMATFKPGSTTFWVEYKPNADGYMVLNAYAHRIEASAS
jgi:glutamate synthase (NADPH/NADH) small chain